jgi:hypothetical protein
MMTPDEGRFYKRLRPRAVEIGVRINRIENEVEPGWPDVLVRGERDLHIWLELKIAKGPNARMKVRPEQLNWIEAHGAEGGIAWILAQSELHPDYMWLISHKSVRRCAKSGCRGRMMIPISKFGDFLLRRMGHASVKLQHADPAPSRVGSGLDFTPSRGIVSRAVL